jgi:drug/metabolite transporter (DMT)-like permease
MNGLRKITPYILLAIFCQLVLTLVPIGIKMVSANIWEIGLARLVLALIFLIPFLKKSTIKLSKRLYPLGIFFALHWGTYAHSVKISNPSTAVIGLSFYGIILLIYSRIFFKKPIPAPFYLLTILAFIGTRLTITEAIELKGFIWGFVSSAFYAALPIINIKNSDISAKERAFYQFFIAFLLYLIFGTTYATFELKAIDWWLLLALGVGGTLIGHGLWLKVTTHLPPVITGGFYYLAIPLSLVYENIFLKVDITALKIFGSLIIIFSNLGILYFQKKITPQDDF